MADWRQIQARIRKAKTSSDPPAQLGELYERTHDAMVAFELAQWHEKAGNASDTVQWYTAAAQRFRRPQWRTKAEEALTRLGAPIPEPIHIPVKEPGGDAFAGATASSSATDAEPTGEASPEGSSENQPMETHNGNGHQPSGEAAAAAGGKRRRRGRRGGRKRHGAGAAAGPQTAGKTTPERPSASAPGRQSHVAAEGGTGEVSVERSMSHERDAERSARPLEPPPATWSGSVGSGWQAGSTGLASSRSRAGDPGLSSRIAQLESQLRRLLSCPLASLDDFEQAPAGPGVLLLSDSDQVTHYYVEACQTLRIGIGNLVRGSRSARGGPQLKASMAEHLGINESRVAKYLKDHCAVRWIQLDTGAADLAHFVTAVLRPVVAE